MQVTLKRPWFSHQSERFDTGTHVMSSDAFDHLPSDAVVDGKPKQEVKKDDLDAPDTASRKVVPQPGQAKTK